MVQTGSLFLDPLLSQYRRKLNLSFKEISSAIIPYCDKDNMRNKLKEAKKIADDADRAKKAAMTEAVCTNK